MLRTAHKILTGLIIALGLLHVLVTFHDYDEFSLRALWFASAGVAIILAGFLNIVLLREVGKDKLSGKMGCMNVWYDRLERNAFVPLHETNSV